MSLVWSKSLLTIWLSIANFLPLFQAYWPKMQHYYLDLNIAHSLHKMHKPNKLISIQWRQLVCVTVAFESNKPLWLMNSKSMYSNLLKWVSPFCRCNLITFTYVRNSIHCKRTPSPQYEQIKINKINVLNK